MTSPEPGVPTGERAAVFLEDSAEELYEDAPCGYLSTLLDGTVVRINGTLLGWLGFDRAEVVGRRRFVDLLTAGGRIYHETHYAPLLRMQGTVREIALDLVAADGRRLPVLVNARLKRDARGEPLLVRLSVFDATERREYERELLRARRRAEESEAHARLLARTLQQSLIPPAVPTVPYVDLGAMYHPAGSGDLVGGDFYDVFETQGGEWVVALGDVCGKGAPAAAVTVLARYTIRGSAVRTPAPAAVLATLNEVLLHDEAERFCTAVCGRVVAGDGWVRLTFACGGHPLPYLTAPGRPTVTVGRPGTVLGVRPVPALHDSVVDLGPGHAVVLFTDGVTEARRGRELFGEDRLAELLTRLAPLDARGIASGVVDAVLRYQDGVARDDIAVLVIRNPPRGDGA